VFAARVTKGVYSVYPGEEAPKTLGTIEPVAWDRTPTGKVWQGAFTVIGEMGMTGQIILLDREKWRALEKTILRSISISPCCGAGCRSR
jgi:hypothetical protein